MKEFMADARRVLHSVREYKWPALFTILCMIVEVGMEIFIPFLSARLINEIQNVAPNVENIIRYSIMLVVMALISMAGGLGGGYFGSKASTGFAKNLRKDMYDKIQTFSFENIDQFSQASLITRMTNDVTRVQNTFQMCIRIVIRSPLMFIFSIIMGFYTGGQMAWIFVAIIPIMLIGLLTIFLKANPIFRRVFKKYDKLNESVQENVSGIRVVKSYVREDYEQQKFDAASDDITNDFIKAEKIMAFTNPIMVSCMYLTLFLVMGFGSYMIVSTFGNEVDGVMMWGALSTGQMSSLITYGMQILMSLIMLSMIFVMLIMSIASIRRCGKVLGAERTIKNPENPVMEVKNGDIEFKNVNFKYNEKAQKDALHGLNFKIKSGSFVGIIGSTGSGKTSLVNLISRLYDIKEGEVKVGGVNVKNYDLKVLRDEVSVVLQKNVLFSGTIKSNLRWGKENATDEEMVEACKIAQADPFIQEFKEKYDHEIEQGGANVSGGQKQRLCIARALLKNPKILILDDSTSAVDTKTDSIIRANLAKSLPNTTKIVIAQRISSIENADMIIVMDDGKIDAIGTNEELLKSNKIYQEVYYTQNRVGGK